MALDWTLALIYFLALPSVMLFSNIVSVPSKTERMWYTTNKYKVLDLPDWIFGAAWTILVFLTNGAMYYHTAQNEDNSYYDTILILFFVYFYLYLTWTYIFFRQRWFGLAFVQACAMFIISVVITVLSGLDKQWLVMGLFIPLCLWLLFAVGLSFAWFVFYDKKNQGFSQMTN